jgi:hypothetical protein
MSELPNKFPEDIELLTLGKAFTYSTLKCFVGALKMRFVKNGSKLRQTGGIDKTTLLEFFEGCNAISIYNLHLSGLHSPNVILVALEETKAILKADFDATGKPPNEKVNIIT